MSTKTISVEVDIDCDRCLNPLYCVKCDAETIAAEIDLPETVPRGPCVDCKAEMICSARCHGEPAGPLYRHSVECNGCEATREYFTEFPFSIPLRWSCDDCVRVRAKTA